MQTNRETMIPLEAALMLYERLYPLVTNSIVGKSIVKRIQP